MGGGNPVCINPGGWIEGGWISPSVVGQAGGRGAGKGRVGGWEGTRELLLRAAQGEEGSVEGLVSGQLEDRSWLASERSSCTWQLLGTD